MSDETKLAPRWVGGSWAPQLTSADLPRLKQAAADAGRMAGDYMLQLIKMLEVFWETPESTLTPTPHPNGFHDVIPLTKVEVDRIWDAVPWQHELNMMVAVFDQELADPVPPGLGSVSRKDPDVEAIYARFYAENPEAKKIHEARKVAFHLLWYGVELNKDREPVTQEMLAKLRA